MITKYFVFAWYTYRTYGGMNDLAKVCDTLDEAEQSLSTLDTQDAPYGFWDSAEIIEFHDNFTWRKIATYSMSGRSGEWVLDPEPEDERGLREIE